MEQGTSEDRALTDAELLRVFKLPTADLSLLSRQERQRLVDLTAQKPPTAAWNQPGGDVVLDNLRNALPALAAVARGAGKELAAQGVRGGGWLRKIPGVNTVSSYFPEWQRETQPSGPAESLGATALNTGEFLGAGNLAAIPARLLARMTIGGGTNAALSKLQGAGPIGTTVSAALGAVAPAVGAGLKTGATQTAEKIETSLIKPTTADWNDGFRPKNVFKYDVGGTVEETYAKAGDRIQRLVGQLRGVLQNSPNASVDLDQVTEEVARRYVGNKQASDAAGRLLDKIQFALNKHGIAVPADAMLNLADANLAKQAVGEAGAWVTGAKNQVVSDADQVLEDVANTYYDVLKKQIEAKASGPVAAINRQISEVIPIQRAALRRLPIEARQNIMKISDMAGLASGHPWIGLLDRFLRWGPTANVLAKTPANIAQTPAQLGAFGATAFSKAEP